MRSRQRRSIDEKKLPARDRSSSINNFDAAYEVVRGNNAQNLLSLPFMSLGSLRLRKWLPFVAIWMILMYYLWVNFGRQAYPLSGFQFLSNTLSDFDSKLHPEDHIFRHPKTLQLEWALGSRDQRPDGVLKRVLTVNGTSASCYS